LGAWFVDVFTMHITEIPNDALFVKATCPEPRN